jgi:hypothetical protein
VVDNQAARPTTDPNRLLSGIKMLTNVQLALQLAAHSVDTRNVWLWLTLVRRPRSDQEEEDDVREALAG